MITVDFDQLYTKLATLQLDSPEKFLQTICELLKQEVYHYDWVGFYTLNQQRNELILGPFAGKSTPHIKIPVGKGICGQVAENCHTMVIQDVSQVENYISCGLEVQSEIVVPIMRGGNFVAELDIDSHSPAPFTVDDNIFLAKVCKLIEFYF